MSASSVGVVIANLFLFVVAMTFALVARWRRLRWRPQYGTAVYLVLLAPALVLFGGVEGDRGFALTALVPTIIGLAILVGGQGRRD
ncbi:MAG TPA: hypothetical protein PLQ13_03440 [Candidatus Krumholzibacteria bacterium]|nr:hypothetical protein [Candidatus Krumholzibacteria bacterium]